MNCKRAQLEIALWVGDDLDEAAVEGLERHLSECSLCRKHWEKLKASLNRLKAPSVVAAVCGSQEAGPRAAHEFGSFSMHDSVWPGLLSRLPDRNRGPQPMEFNGWLPALAVIAASVAIAAFWQNEPIGYSPSGVTGNPESRPVPDVEPRYDFPGSVNFGQGADHSHSDNRLLGAARGRLPFGPSSWKRMLIYGVNLHSDETRSRRNVAFPLESEQVGSEFWQKDGDSDQGSL